MQFTVAVHLNQQYHQRNNNYDYYVLNTGNWYAESVVQSSDCRYLQHQRPSEQEINAHNHKQQTRKDDLVDAVSANNQVVEVRFSLLVVS